MILCDSLLRPGRAWEDRQSWAPARRHGHGHDDDDDDGRHRDLRVHRPTNTLQTIGQSPAATDETLFQL